MTSIIERIKNFFYIQKAKFHFKEIFKECKKDKRIKVIDLRYLYSVLKNSIYSDIDGYDGIIVPVEDPSAKDGISLLISNMYQNAFKFSILCNPVIKPKYMYGKRIPGEVVYNIEVRWKQSHVIDFRSNSYEGYAVFDNMIDYYRCENTSINKDFVDAIIDLLCDSALQTIKKVKLTDRVIYCERK